MHCKKNQISNISLLWIDMSFFIWIYFTQSVYVFLTWGKFCIFKVDRTVMSVQLSKCPTQTNVHIFFVMRTLKIYSLSNFKIFSLLLLTSVSPCCEINLLNVICLAEMNHCTMFSQLQLAFGSHYSSEFNFLNFTNNIRSFNICLPLLGLFHLT